VRVFVISITLYAGAYPEIFRGRGFEFFFVWTGKFRGGGWDIFFFKNPSKLKKNTKNPPLTVIIERSASSENRTHVLTKRVIRILDIWYVTIEILVT